jgi:hypothetical protein
METTNRFLPLLALVATATMLPGCGGGSQHTGLAPNGIEVVVYDESSRQVMDLRDVTGTLTDGNYVENMKADLVIGPGGDSMAPAYIAGFTGARARPGTYDVRLSKPGYEPWEKAKVVVNRAGFSIQTVRLEASMHRTSH